MNHGPLMAILYVMYGMLLGGVLLSAIVKKRMAKYLRSRFLKITETHTLVITDFAGKDVSLERFCDKLFGHDAYFRKDQQTRRLKKRIWLVAILLFSLTTIAVLAAYFSS